MRELDFNNPTRDQQVLDTFARAIVDNVPPDREAKLSNAYGREVVDYLDKKVHELTNGKRSVRRAANFLFSLEVLGLCQYLVYCSSDTPKSDEVMELQDDMVLIMLTGSLVFPVAPARPETIAKGQRSRIEHDEWHRDREAIDTVADRQVSSIRKTLRGRIAEQRNEQNAWTSGALSRLAGGDLKDLLVVCLRLNISFDEIVREALNQ